MLFYPFENYEDFKEIFGVQEHGNGVKSRKNKILLALYKDKNAFKQLVALRNGKDVGMWEQIVTRTNLVSLEVTLNNMLRSERWDHPGELILNGSVYGSPLYRTDDYLGVCEDGSTNAIRYVNLENGRVFKMKAGKMINHLISLSPIFSAMPEQIKRWYSEEFVAKWIAYAKSKGCGKMTLHVDRDFEKIYNSDCCKGDFHSCMVDNDQWNFYQDSVRAHAAYLTNDDDIIVARCIIYDEVHVKDTDDILRLAERQYSTECDDVLKRMLIDALIEEGYIDGYKKIGAGCSDSRLFVYNDGTAIDGKLWIKCDLEDGDTISYQDSFKFFDYSAQRADNYGHGEFDLSTTDATICLNRDRVYSEFNDEYIDRDNAVYVESRDDWFYHDQTYWCENTRTNEFDDDVICIANGDCYYAGTDCRYPEDYDLYRCPYCNEWFYRGCQSDYYYSDITEKYYCCEDCLTKDEADYKERNWEYSEYDNEYFESDVIVATMWNDDESRFKDTTIHYDTFYDLVDEGRAVEYEGDYFIDELVTDADGSLAPSHLPSVTISATA